MKDIYSFEPLWGTWKIDKLLGEGGFGSVYRAVRRDYGQEYWAAIKHISIPASVSALQGIYDEGLASDERSAQMYYEQMLIDLQDEINFMYKLKGNTNIVAYEDHLTIPKQDMPGFDIFIRMELLHSLNEVVHSGQMTTAEVCRLGIDICRALELLEKHNIVHRDIKPANILRNNAGDYKLGDFGIARQIGHANTVMSIKGTYPYMAPEVFNNEQVSTRADIYSIGLVMHRLLNKNKTPFVPVDADYISAAQFESAMTRRMMGEAIPAPVMADEALAEIIGIACAYKPEDRFHSAEAFRMLLEGYYKKKFMPVREPETEPERREKPESVTELEPLAERVFEPEQKSELQPKIELWHKTKPGPQLLTEQGDPVGYTKENKDTNKPAGLAKRVLIGTVAVAVMGLFFSFFGERALDTDKDDNGVYIEAENNGETDSEKLVDIYYTTEDGVSVRDSAGTSGNKIGMLAHCEKVYVISKDSNDWYKIEYNGGEAYISGAYIKKVSDINTYHTSSAVTTGDVNARTAASTKARVICVLKKGTNVKFIKDAGNSWSMIEYEGKILHVSSRYLDIEVS